jgi:type II secretory pathway pseudopilin PulG
MTLIEAMVAMAVLAIGTAGVTSMLVTVDSATKKAGFQTQALDLFASFSTQVQDAACDYLPDGTTDIDPGLAINAGGYGAPVAGSSITLVGGWPTVGPQKLTLLYNVTVGPPAPAVPSFDLTVQICEVNSFDHVVGTNCVFGTNGSTVRTFPLHKVCTYRADQIGRGE